MILNKEQVKQLRAVFKQNKDVEEVILREEGKTGIGVNLYADYVKFSGEHVRIDITDYDRW